MSFVIPTRLKHLTIRILLSSQEEIRTQTLPPEERIQEILDDSEDPDELQEAGPSGHRVDPEPPASESRNSLGTTIPRSMNQVMNARLPPIAMQAPSIRTRFATLVEPHREATVPHWVHLMLPHCSMRLPN